MSDFSVLRNAARALRSRTGFEGSFAKFNGETGLWTRGSKDKATVIDGARFLADVRNALTGWQKFGPDSKPVHAGVGALMTQHELPARDTLGDLDQNRWRGGNDPWEVTCWLALFDLESRERLIFSTSSSGGRDALGILLEAFCDHNEVLEEAAEEWPLIELVSESYNNSFGKLIHKPIFDLCSWEMPPNDFRAKALKPPAPPPLPNASALKLESAKSTVKQPAGACDMDDEIPF